MADNALNMLYTLTALNWSIEWQQGLSFFPVSKSLQTKSRPQREKARHTMQPSKQKLWHCPMSVHAMMLIKHYDESLSSAIAAAKPHL